MMESVRKRSEDKNSVIRNDRKCLCRVEMLTLKFRKKISFQDKPKLENEMQKRQDNKTCGKLIPVCNISRPLESQTLCGINIYIKTRPRQEKSVFSFRGNFLK